MSEANTVTVRVRGRVQGVGFRAWLREQAELKSLDGWVRNRRDGTVEAVLSGDSSAVTAMVAALRQGPRGARIDAVEVGEAGVEALGPRPAGGGFALLPTL